MDIGAGCDFAETFVKGLEVLGFSYEDRTEPWENACGVYSTVLAEAAIRFQAEAMSETFPAAGPVKTRFRLKATVDEVLHLTVCSSCCSQLSLFTTNGF